MQTSVLERLDAAAAAYADKVMFKDPDSSLTFSQFDALTRRIGTALSRVANAGEPVAVMSGRHVLTPACYLGAVRAGCFYAPIDGDMPKARLNQILSVIQAPTMLVDRAHLEMAQTLDFDGTLIVLEEIMDTPADEAVLSARAATLTCTSPLYVIFTSGSTGKPKGVITSHLDRKSVV